MGRAKIRSKLTAAASNSTTTTATAPSTSTAAKKYTKKSLRTLRRASLITRLNKTANPNSTRQSSGTSSSLGAGSGGGFGSRAHRRRNKNIASTIALSSLSTLGEALPTDQELQTAEDAVLKKKTKQRVGGILSRPGAMKRKERVVKSECERFAKNLAILSEKDALMDGKVGAGAGAGTTGNTWSTLRGFIGATLEKKEEFLKMEE